MDPHTEINPELGLDNAQLDEAPGAARVPLDHPVERGTVLSRGRRLKKLARDPEGRLAQHIVGQGNARRALARAVQRAALGWSERGPLASLLFLGPTGTGKTELARALARELSPTGRAQDALIQIDGASFGERHETSRLMGAPPGYIGHGEPGLLARGLDRNPSSVLLVDEVEKADARLHDLLLEVLDEGTLTDGQGRTLDFSRCFLILTSNAGTRELERARSALGFQVSDSLEPAARSEIVERALGESFRPEFLARLEDVVLFEELTRSDSIEIARRALTALAVRVRRGGQRVRFTRSVAPWLVEHSSDGKEGARGILHLLKRSVEAPLAELALGAQRGQWFEVAVRGGAPRARLVRA